MVRGSRRQQQFWIVGLIALAAVTAARPAAASPIALNTWLQFTVHEVGVAARGCSQLDPLGRPCTPTSQTPTTFLDAPAWTFTAPSLGSILTVVDAFISRERYEVFDFGQSIGLTSLPANRPLVSCGDDPLTCLNTAGMSSGLFVLDPGPHALTLVPVQGTRENPGTGYLFVDAASTVVPEPATLLMVGTGLVVVARRRRRS